MQEDRDLAKGALINAAGTFAKSSKAIFLIVLPRLFGAKIFGLHLLIVALMEALSKCSGTGMEWGTLRHVIQLKAAGKESEIRPAVYAIIARQAAIGLLLSGLIATLSVAIAKVVFRKEEMAGPFALSCLSLPLLAAEMVFLYSIRAARKMQYEVYVKSLVEPVALIGAGILAYVLRPDIYGISAAYVFSILAGFVFSFFFFLKVFSSGTGRSPIPWADFMAYSLPMSGMDFLNNLKSKIDVMVMGRFLTLELVGIFGAIVELGNLLKKVRLAFEPIFMPIVGHLHEVREKAKLKRQFALAVRWSMTLSLVLLMPMIIAPGLFLQPFGTAFLAGTGALRVVAVGMFVYITIGLSDSVLSMTGHPVANLINSASLVALNFALDIALIPRFGIMGAAVANTLSLILVSLWRMKQVRDYVGIHPFGMNQFKPLAAAVIGAIPAFLLHRAWPKPSYGHWVAEALLFISIYLLAFRYLLGVEPEDIDVIRRVKSRLPGRASAVKNSTAVDV